MVFLKLTVQTIGEEQNINSATRRKSKPEEAERRLKGTAKLEFSKQQKQGTEGDFIAESQVNEQLKAQRNFFSQQEGEENQAKLAENKRIIDQI